MEKTYKISEVCGDWALHIPPYGKMDEEMILIFNSRNNAKLVKSVLEWEDAHPNAAVPYMPTLTPQNDLLTLDELRKMDGQPVWIKQLKDLSVCDTGWALIDTCTDKIRVWWPGSEVEDEPSEEYYGKTWVAYGRPPERQEDNNETD